MTIFLLSFTITVLLIVLLNLMGFDMLLATVIGAGLSLLLLFLVVLPIISDEYSEATSPVVLIEL